MPTLGWLQQARVPSVVLDKPPYFSRSGASQSHDVSPDGSRFLVIKGAAASESGSSAPTIVIVQNWTEELKGLVPTTR